jgi:hypothetical protein
MLAIIGWIVFGLIAGLIAKAIMPGTDPGGRRQLQGFVGVHQYRNVPPFKAKIRQAKAFKRNFRR